MRLRVLRSVSGGDGAQSRSGVHLVDLQDRGLVGRARAIPALISETSEAMRKRHGRGDDASPWDGWVGAFRCDLGVRYE